jgi:GIY-YIG catalytic domain
MNTKDKIINAGVYAILCFCTGLTYIGASTRLVQRLHEQMVMLKSNRHYNKRLQRDWSRFGADCFHIIPVEFVDDVSTLPDREKAWIEKCRSEGEVYNVVHGITEEHCAAFERKSAEVAIHSLASKRGKDYAFVSPTGIVFTTKGLPRFCEAFGLNISHMSKVARGILEQHQGWTLLKGSVGSAR